MCRIVYGICMELFYNKVCTNNVFICSFTLKYSIKKIVGTRFIWFLNFSIKVNNNI